MWQATVPPALEMDRRMKQLIDNYFSYYYHYYIWRRRLLAAIALCLAWYSRLLDVRKRDQEMGRGKGKGKEDADEPSRVRTITWDDGHTKFMLEWYIEYKKNQHAGFVSKKAHHMKCADALNKQFAMGVTTSQVDRHYRNYKENWGIVQTALSNSGNGFDVTRCKVTISESKKAKLNDRARRLLAKPIKFFHEMEELFQGTRADGSLAVDPETCLDDGDNNNDPEGMNGLSSYGHQVNLTGDDSDTLPSPRENCSSSKARIGMKRGRGMKSPGKPPKPKSHFIEATEDISITMKAVAKALAEPPPPPVPQPGGTHASLWQKIEALPIATEDKISIGVHLSPTEMEGMRDFLSSSSDKTVETWVYQFLCDKDGN